MRSSPQVDVLDQHRSRVVNQLRSGETTADIGMQRKQSPDELPRGRHPRWSMRMPGCITSRSRRPKNGLCKGKHLLEVCLPMNSELQWIGMIEELSSTGSVGLELRRGSRRRSCRHISVCGSRSTERSVGADSREDGATKIHQARARGEGRR